MRMLGVFSEGLYVKTQKPMIRFDCGLPNMAQGTRKLIMELELLLSPARA